MSPLYTFRCRNHLCPQVEFELRLKMEHDEVVCPNCNEKAERILGRFTGKWGDTPKYHGAGC